MPGYRKRSDWGLGLFWDWNWFGCLSSSSSSDAPFVCEPPNVTFTVPETGEMGCAALT